MVSMGVYVMEPQVLELIPANEPFDFPDLVHALTRDGRDVGVYRYSGYWRDLGRHEDYEAANAEWLDPNVLAAGAEPVVVTTNERISVIVPMRDEAAHVGHLVADIASQDFPGKIEVFVADGGSTDGSRELLDRARRGPVST